MAAGELAEPLQRAIDAHVDSIEYLDRSANPLYPSRIVAAIAREKIFLVPPVGYLTRYMAFRENPALRDNPLLTMFTPPALATYILERERFVKNMTGDEANIRQGFANLPAKFAQLRKAGIRMPIGTDCGSPANFHIDAYWWDLETRRQLGVPTDEILTAATVHGAALLGATDIGHLRVSARGDLVVYAGDVRQGKLEISRMRAVAKGGRLFVTEGQWTEPLN